jgi:hypothetical protein
MIMLHTRDGKPLVLVWSLSFEISAFSTGFANSNMGAT